MGGGHYCAEQTLRHSEFRKLTGKLATATTGQVGRNARYLVAPRQLISCRTLRATRCCKLQRHRIKHGFYPAALSLRPEFAVALLIAGLKDESG
jgi:hypothetical protein